MIKPYGNRKSVIEIPPLRASASHFVCMCVLSLYIYVSGMLKQGGGRGGGDSLQLKNGKSGGVLSPF